MKLPPVISRLIAGLLILAAISGMALSVAGLIGVQRARPRLQAWGTRQIAQADTALQSLDEALSLAENALATASASITEVNRALAASADTLKDAQPTLDEFKTLLDKSIPETVQDTQTALYAAQSDALLIESTLQALTAIPFVPGEPYQPEQSLSESLGQIAYTLGNIPDSTARISSDLDVTKSNLALMQVSLISLSLQLDDIQSSLADVRQAVPRYRALLSQMQERVQHLAENLDHWLRLAAATLNALFVWLFLTQGGLLLQGLDWWQRGVSPAGPSGPDD